MTRANAAAMTQANTAVLTQANAAAMTQENIAIMTSFLIIFIIVKYSLGFAFFLFLPSFLPLFTEF